MSTAAVTPDPYASIAVPLSGQSDPYASIAKPISASDALTSNPNGEGTYKMVGAQGQTVSVPYSKVRGAQDQRFQVVPDDAARYTKDSTGSDAKAVQADFDARTATSPSEPLLETGIKSVVHAVGSPFVHPVDTAKGLARLAGQAVTGDTYGAGSDLVTPIVQDYQDGGAKYAATKLAGNTFGQVALGEAGGAGLKVAAPVISDVLSAAKTSVADAASSAKQYIRPTSDPAIVPPEEIQAQKIAQSILPQGGIKPEFVQAIQEQAPAIKAYAERTGNPLNTQAEGLKAAQGVAAEGLQHYQDEVLAPVAGRSVVLDSANTELGSKATIGDIDSRITKLNKLVNTAPANSTGAALDVLAKSKWGDELSYLRGKLYPALENTTGIPANDIQNLREGYGGEFSLANNLESAQNARLTRTGVQSQGQTSIAVKKPSILELPGQVVQAIKGGEQSIADRQFSSAMNGVKSAEPIRPTPPPIDTDAIAAQQDIAKQQFLDLHQSEQAAQDAAQQRSTVAEGTRQANRVQGGAQAWVSQGYTKVVSHLANDPSSGLSRADLIKISNTPQGRSLLIRASDLTPNSAPMRDIVKQIAAAVPQP